jgi:hypothetical protein
MLKIVPCIFHCDKLDRQAGPAVGLSHADGLVKRTPSSFSPWTSNSCGSSFDTYSMGLALRYNSGFSSSVPRKNFTMTRTVSCGKGTVRSDTP